MVKFTIHIEVMFLLVNMSDYFFKMNVKEMLIFSQINVRALYKARIVSLKTNLLKLWYMISKM